MDKRIYLNESGMKKLREIFKVSHVTVWKALTYKTESALAEKIRYTALSKLGGTPSRWFPDCETTHEEVERTMTQRWGERVKLIVYKDTGDVAVFIDGKKEREEKNMMMRDFLELQKEVELKALTL